MNGVGGWPGPRGADTPNPVKYPFRSADGGSVIDKQTTGERTWDFNTDGAAHYGMVPDWIEDIRIIGGQEVVDDIFAGAESYLRTWGSAEKHDSGPNLASGAAASASTRSGGTRSSASRPARPWTATRAPAGPANGRRPVAADRPRIREPGQTRHPRLGGGVREVYRIELSQDGTNWQTAWSTDRR